MFNNLKFLRRWKTEFSRFSQKNRISSFLIFLALESNYLTIIRKKVTITQLSDAVEVFHYPETQTISQSPLCLKCQ